MSPISKTTLQELETQYMQDAEFATAMQELEPGYQVARLRIMRGLSQKELAEFLAQEYVNQSNYKKKRFVLLKEAPSCFITVVDRGEFYSGTIDKFNCIDTIQFSETHQKMCQVLCTYF